MTDPSPRAPKSLRERIVRGVAGQGFGMVGRVLVQLAMVSVMLPAWGVELYGEWLTLVGIALLLGASDLGFMQAAASDIVFAASRDDRDHARDVFRTMGLGVGILFAAVAAAAAGLGTWAPLNRWLHLHDLTEGQVTAILVMVALQAVGLMTCMLFFCGYAAVGDYGDAFAILSLIYILEWLGAALAAVTGHGPLEATAVFLTIRLIGMVAMYIHMRRRVPWLSLGIPVHNVQVRKRLMKPALAGAGLGWGTALSNQALLVIIGAASGAAAVAAFATIRAVSRIVIQIATSIGSSVGPEFARAFSVGDQALLRSLQRRVSQTAVWSAVVMAVPIGIGGDWLIGLVTRNTVSATGAVLFLLLLVAVVDVAWFTSGANLYATNRHQRVGFIYVAASAVSLGLAYVMVLAWGIDGAALSILCLSVFMLFVTLSASLRGTGDTLAGWVKAVVDPRGLVQVARALVRR